MSDLNWENRIREWSHKRIEALEDYEKEELPQEVIESRWFGYPGATEEQIIKAETRLSVTFPPSYREFLKVSNGLRAVTEDDIMGIKFHSTEVVTWLATNEQELIDMFTQQDKNPILDQEYFVYGESHNPYTYRSEYFQTLLDVGGSIVAYNYYYSLNPQIITNQGEWEAWWFDRLSPPYSVQRYPSFSEMMNDYFSNDFWGE